MSFKYIKHQNKITSPGIDFNDDDDDSEDDDDNNGNETTALNRNNIDLLEKDDENDIVEYKFTDNTVNSKDTEYEDEDDVIYKNLKKSNKHSDSSSSNSEDINNNIDINVKDNEINININSNGNLNSSIDNSNNIVDKKERRILTIKATASVIVWMCLNLALQLTNKYLIDIGFKFPIFIILTGTIVTFIGCMIFMFVLKKERFPAKEALMRRKWTLLIAALFQSATYVLENVSIVTISISLNQIIKATAPAFVVVLSMIVYRERFSVFSLLSTVIIVVGAALAVVNNPDFEREGFFYSLGSTIFGALQTIIIASLLKDKSLNTFTILTVTSLPSALAIMPVFGAIEVPRFINEPVKDPLVPSILVVALAIAAFFYNLSHFYIVQYTSALYFAIVGNAKVVLIIIISSLIFPMAPFLPINYVGMVITIAGFFAYNLLKYIRQHKQQQQNPHYQSLNSSSDAIDCSNSICLKIYPKKYQKLSSSSSSATLSSDTTNSNNNNNIDIIHKDNNNDKSPLINRGHNNTGGNHHHQDSEHSKSFSINDSDSDDDSK